MSATAVQPASELDVAPAGFQSGDRLPGLRPSMLKLHRAFQAGQWSADDCTDWSRAPIVEGFGPLLGPARQFRAAFVADMFAGEQLTLRRAGHRLDALEQMDEKLCYAAMIVDEHRHAEVLGRYQQKLGLVVPAFPALVDLLDHVDALDAEAFILCSLVLEAITIAMLPSAWRFTLDPLLRDFLPLICRDEQRHGAFAQLYLSDRAPRWSLRRRAELGDILQEAYARQAQCMRGRIEEVELPRPAIRALNSVGTMTMKSGTAQLRKGLSRLGLELKEPQT